jgi:dTDP-4-amino-4,6-dideoxygalactose transaminase
MIPAAKPSIGREERRAVRRVLKSGMLAQGPEVAAFENEFSKLINSKYCIAVNSGTSALHLALLAAEIKTGDEVIVPSFSFAATANVVALTGATPVFADIDENTFNLDPLSVESLISSKTRAVMPVHLYGQPAQIDELTKICAKYGLILLEDAAQAVGASFDGQPVGTFGIVGSFSFYPTKNMTSGEGGMAATNDPEIARTIKLLRNQGMEKRYANEIVGFNNRMTDIHAAIGRVQLNKLNGWTIARQKNAAFLNANLRNVITPLVINKAVHVWHQYTIRILDQNRDNFSEQLKKRGVGSGVYYPTPIHKLPSFSQATDLPATNRVSQQCLSLPVHPSLTQRDLEKIVQSVNEIATAGS